MQLERAGEPRTCAAPVVLRWRVYHAHPALSRGAKLWRASGAEGVLRERPGQSSPRQIHPVQAAGRRTLAFPRKSSCRKFLLREEIVARTFASAGRFLPRGEVSRARERDR